MLKIKLPRFLVILLSISYASISVCSEFHYNRRGRGGAALVSSPARQHPRHHHQVVVPRQFRDLERSTPTTSIGSLSSNLFSLADTIAQQNIINSAMSQHRARIDTLPYVALMLNAQSLKEEIAFLNESFAEEIDIRNALLNKMGFTPAGAAGVAVPERLYREYLTNSTHLMELTIALKIKEECLAYNNYKAKAIGPVLSEIEGYFQAQTPTTKRCHTLEREIISLEKYLKNAERLIACQEKLKIIQQALTKERSKQGRALLFEQQSQVIAEIQSLAAQFNIKIDDLTITDLTKVSAILEREKVVSLCREELTRLKTIDAFDRQCVADHHELQKLYQKVSSKWGLGGDRQLSEAITQATQTAMSRSEVLYELTPAGKKYLEYCGEDPSKIQSFLGTTVQKEIAQQLCGVINRLGRDMEICRDTAAEKYLNAVARLAMTDIEISKKGTPSQAIGFAKLVGALERVTDSVIIKTVKGITRGVKYAALDKQATLQDISHQIYEACAFIYRACKMDPVALHKIKTMCVNFIEVPADKKLEHTTALFTAILTSDTKITVFESFDKGLQSVVDVMKHEQEALKELHRLTISPYSCIKDVLIPPRWENAINRLIDQGKIITGDDVRFWVEYFEAPLLSVTNRALIEFAETVITTGPSPIPPLELLQQATLQAAAKKADGTILPAKETLFSDRPVTTKAVLQQFMETTQLVPATEIRNSQLKELHDHYQRTPAHSKSSYEPYRKARIAALAESESGEVVCRKYELLPASERWIKENGLVHYDWKMCNGSAIKVELHGELVSILNKAAALDSQSKHERVHATTKTIANTLKLACEANDRNALYASCKLTDLCWSLVDYGHVVLDYSRAVGEGVVDGVLRVEHMVTHPRETVKEIAHAAYNIAYVLCELELIGNIDTPADRQFAKDTIQMYVHKIDAVEKALKEKISTMSGPDKVRAGTAIATEMLLAGKIGAAVKPLFSMAKSRVTEIAKNVTRTAPEAIAAGEVEVRLVAETYDHIVAMQADKAKQAGTSVSKAATKATEAEVKASHAAQEAGRASASSVADKVKPAVMAQSVHTTEEAARQIWGQSKELRSLEQMVAKLKDGGNLAKVERLEKDSISLLQHAKYETEAKSIFESIRGMTDDISKISQRTGIPEDIIRKIKNHVFYEEHILFGGRISRFDPGIDMGKAWLRLVDGRCAQSDLNLLLHEYAESLLMNGDKIGYEVAHSIVEKTYPWWKIF